MRPGTNNIKPTLILTGFVLPFCVQAQQTTAAPVPSTNSTLAMVMILISLVLAFVIWGMGHVLITLGKQLMEKRKQAKILPVVLLAGLMLSSLFSTAQTTATATETVAATTVADYGGMNATGFWVLASVIIIEVIAICFILFFINRIQQELLPESVKKPLPLAAWWSKMDKKLFTKAVAVEQEADILLDHDYDGIKELDNALPPWWKYGFYFTIAVAFIYILNFHVMGSGKNPTEEYDYEMAKAKAALEVNASKNADKVDENNIKMPSQAGLDAGKEIYTSVCWTCHGKLGEGGAGPNLTDDYWIHKGSLNDIYRSIKIGYPEKGMQSWEKNYSPKEMNNLAGYIKTLKGTNPPNPKAPQGDLYAEESTAPATDSAKTEPKTVTDSTVTKK